MRRPFSPDEISRILAAADAEWKGLVLAGLCTGQRLGDLARLRWSNIDLQNRVITLVTGKTSDRVSIWILPQLWDYLMQIEASDDPEAPLFPAAHSKLTLRGSVHQLSKEFHNILVSVGLARKWEYRKTGTGRGVPRDNTGLSFHCLRHSAVTFFKRLGVPEAITMAVVGHRTRAVNSQYTHIDSGTVKDWLQRVSDPFAKLIAM